MAMYTVDKNVPVPDTVTRYGGGVAKYPWDQMEVGDSFFVPKITVKRAASIAGSGYDWLKRRGLTNEYRVLRAPVHSSPTNGRTLHTDPTVVGYRFWILRKERAKI